MRVETNAALAARTTLRVAATARYLVRVDGEAPRRVARELADLLAAPRYAGLPRLVLGGGSNVLFAADYPGVVILPRGGGIAVREDADSVILTAAALLTKKDYPTLLLAFSRLVSRRPARLVALGQGKLLTRLQAQTRELGIDDKVDFAGLVSNPIAYMAQADLFVLSSRCEGMPQVLVQAMMVGCRLVATDCPFGPAELLGDGEYGRLAPVGDPARLAEAVERELDTPRDAARLRARAAELFGVERAVDAYERLLLPG